VGEAGERTAHRDAGRGRPEKLRQAKKLYDEAAQKYARSLVGRLAADASTRLATGK
jgi:hypothetical protein